MCACLHSNSGGTWAEFTFRYMYIICVCICERTCSLVVITVMVGRRRTRRTRTAENALPTGAVQYKRVAPAPSTLMSSSAKSNRSACMNCGWRCRWTLPPRLLVAWRETRQTKANAVEHNASNIISTPAPLSHQRTSPLSLNHSHDSPADAS